MRHHSSIARNFCALLLALAATPACADWRYVEAQSAIPAPAEAFLLARDGAVWTIGYDGVRRVDAAGHAIVTDGIPHTPVWTGDNRRFGAALPDGGIVLAEFMHAFARIGADGRLRWRSAHEDASYVRTNAAGDIWIVDREGPARLRDDGTVAARIDGLAYESTRPLQAIAVDAAGAAIVATASHVVKAAKNGAMLWRLDNTGGNVQQILPTPDGAIAFVGEAPSQSGAVGAFTLRSLDAQTGIERWSRTVADLRITVKDAQQADAGALYVLGRREGNAQRAAVLLRVATNGAIAWQRDVCMLSSGQDYALAVDADGGATVACAAGERARALRFDRSGAATGDVELPLAVVLQAQWREDGTLALAGLVAGSGPPRVVALDRTLASVASPLAEIARAEPLEILSSEIANDGSTYLLTRAHHGYGLPAARTLTRVAANGERLWSRRIDEPDAARLPLILVGAGRVCIVDTRRTNAVPATVGYAIECFSTAGGETLWRRDYDDAPPAYVIAARIFDDGSITAVRTIGDDGFEIARIGSNGSVTGTTRGAGQAAFVVIGANGSVVVPIDYLRPSAALLQFDATGRQVYAIAASALGANWLGMSDTQIADDGSVVVLGRLAGAPPSQESLWMLAPNGTVRWHRDLGADYGLTEIRRVGDALYVRESDYPGPIVPSHIDAPTRIMRLDAADGSVRWQQSSTVRAFNGSLAPYGSYAVTPAGDKLIAVDSRIDRLRVRRYDAATGALERERYLACVEQCSHPSALRVVANGATIGVQDVVEPQRGQTALVSAWDDFVAAEPATRLDQPGIAGAWWSPYANGEGFVLDYLPDSRTLFMPWFTFSRAGGNDPSGQRWYVVQGAVPANATSVELPITESTGGAFDAGPPVTPAIVGTATLTFTDCDNGTLRYRFDEGRNDGATGTITLSRLSPATQNCILADGSTQTRTSAPANGFDARMSGSWFEPATSGQGLQLTVQPGGIFFAPWFTYDPAGTSNDPGKQHWYTVQGSLANARDGVAELPIVQTIGGAFDSVPTNNMYAVGKATITMLACDRAKLDYRFDDTELAAPMRGRSGSIDLVKAGGCAP